MFFNVPFLPIPQLLPLPSFTMKESLTDDKIAWLWGGTKSWCDVNPSMPSTPLGAPQGSVHLALAFQGFPISHWREGIFHSHNGSRRPSSYPWQQAQGILAGVGDCLVLPHVITTIHLPPPRQLERRPAETHQS